MCLVRAFDNDTQGGRTVRMPTPIQASWSQFLARTAHVRPLSLFVDASRMNLTDDFIAKHQANINRALQEMQALEQGAIANPDEKRMVGHYWLRQSSLAPDAAMRAAIDDTLRSIERFCSDVHEGRLRTPAGGLFHNVLVIGIGGSALGPQLATDALGSNSDRMRVFFFDNTDPDGIDKTLQAIERAGGLRHTLSLVVSKSGGTKETRNGMLEVQAAYRAQALAPERFLVAITQAGSELDKVAVAQSWLQRFPMWDWVGGRTSELSAVGLLPAALQGLDIRGMLEGARLMDEATRATGMNNPAMLLALSWLHATGGKGEKDMVVLPYKDRLCLLSRYLQQLVMESLGKEHDLDGKQVHQGIAVYGNKGSTDQHAYVQQLRDGVANFFAVFLVVRQERAGNLLFVEDGITAGDYLHGFYLGTRQALADSGRASVSIVMDQVSARGLGALIALFERAVGFYASFVRVNAYHQPGVEAGKKAAQAVISLQSKLLAALAKAPAGGLDAPALSSSIAADTETVWHLCEQLVANGRVRCVHDAGGLGDRRYTL
jgi:glucose-6-phosphate isomerase